MNPSMVCRPGRAREDRAGSRHSAAHRRPSSRPWPTMPGWVSAGAVDRRGPSRRPGRRRPARGERGGRPIEGFDLGNSPPGYPADRIARPACRAHRDQRHRRAGTRPRRCVRRARRCDHQPRGRPPPPPPAAWPTTRGRERDPPRARRPHRRRGRGEEDLLGAGAILDAAARLPGGDADELDPAAAAALAHYRDDRGRATSHPPRSPELSPRRSAAGTRSRSAWPPIFRSPPPSMRARWCHAWIAPPAGSWRDRPRVAEGGPGPAAAHPALRHRGEEERSARRNGQANRPVADGSDRVAGEAPGRFSAFNRAKSASAA